MHGRSLFFIVRKKNHQYNVKTLKINNYAYNENFETSTLNRTGGNGKLAINFAWP